MLASFAHAGDRLDRDMHKAHIGVFRFPANDTDVLNVLFTNSHMHMHTAGLVQTSRHWLLKLVVRL